LVTEPRRRVERPKLLSHTATSTVLREEATEVAWKMSLVARSNLTTASSQRGRVQLDPARCQLDPCCQLDPALEHLKEGRGEVEEFG